MNFGLHMSVGLGGAVPANISMANTERAVQEVGSFLQVEWAKLARSELGAKGGSYINGINADGAVEYPFEGDRLSISISNSAPHAWVIENGHPAFNLAERIDWGKIEEKLTKDNTPWKRKLIFVPFRHFTPPRAGEGATPSRTKQSMPKSIYDIAKGMSFNRERMTFKTHLPSRVTNVVRDKHRGVKAVRGFGPQGGKLTSVRSPALQSAHGQPRAKTAASYAAAVDHARKTGRNPPSTHHKAPFYEHLRKTGRHGHTQYMTWRAIHEESIWMIPARPALRLAQRTLEMHEAAIQRKFQAAFAEDVKAAINSGISGT